jgi:uncharacterized DUF497 family protein
MRFRSERKWHARKAAANRIFSARLASKFERRQYESG